ncbi:MAG: twin-arginine translocation signal domain-containing protein [Bacteroidetes bacterium]|nr:twin-arginine translocation signal domain-containing protein [Bacteroidota bacterium]
MKKITTRRDFIKKTGLAAAGVSFAPYILPTGRLFAPTGNRSSEHVVMVAFAGGVRQQESVLKRYLDDSQGEPYPGNIMYNMFSGAPPENKIVYGTGTGGMNPIPAILSESLESQGTVFKEVTALSAGHYGGLNSLVQGSTTTTQGLKQRPINPTIFEYLRRHGGYSATDVWFVGNGIGNSTPLLNHSAHPDYGSDYAGNFFAPTVTFSEIGAQFMADAKIYHPENELAPMYKLQTFLDLQFQALTSAGGSLGNTIAEKENIKAFMEAMYAKVAAGTLDLPPVTDNGDLYTMAFAVEVLKWFKPAFMMVNLSAVDSCHADFSNYLAALHRADHAVGHLWNQIQTDIPEMAGQTTLLCTPECGRNLTPNNILDQNDWLAFDHSDANALRVWTLMAGPSVPAGLSIGSEANPIGLVSDTMMTVADLLGVKPEVQSAGMTATGTMSLLDQL